MNQKIVSALERLKTDYGSDIFHDSRRVGAFLSDFLKGEHKGDRHLLLQILDTDISKKMLNGHNFSEAEFHSQAAYISEKFLFREDAVLSALKCLEQVLSPKVTTQPPLPGISNRESLPQKEGAETEEAKSIRLAAEQGQPSAQLNLGNLYYRGEGVPQDDKQAAEWYRKAAEQGLPEAQLNLGVFYKDGNGVPQDYKRAAEWYRKAAEQGHLQAQYNLGALYEKGQGVPKDQEAAQYWFNQARENGYKF
jgi:TPR repeat protein